MSWINCQPSGRSSCSACSPARDSRRYSRSACRPVEGPTAGPDRGGRLRVVVGGSLVGLVIAALCFLIVLAAIGWGIYEVYQIGHPAPLA